jgi:RNA polymerase sigma factor (sigma-70 family)
MQNMSFTVLQAIDTFDPTKNFKFVNYLVGYFKSAISKTFRDTNVVSVPTGRRKILKEMQQSIRTEPLGDAEEILSYTGVEYMENGTAGMPNFDFDEDLHNKQLIEWLEEALSSEADVVTSDERRVLVLHYGLFGHDRLPYHDIAKLRAAEGRGCAYSRLSQIHTKAVKKLQRFFSDRGIDEY